MSKHTTLAIFLLMILSCKETLYIDEVNRNNFCKYFTVKIGKYVDKGKTRNTFSAKINKAPNDAVASFIQSHKHRFEYISNKLLSILIKKNNTFDSSFLTQQFRKSISTDSFYYNFIHLTSGSKTKVGTDLTFTTAELKKVASHFFMCDDIREKDTAFSYHICVGINGISELKTTKDYTVLEAFCFEAIFRTLGHKPKFLNNFHHYISESSKVEKEHFIDFKSHLTAVRNRCYALMEKDEDLEKAIISYYIQNLDNINFKIE